MDGQIKMNFEVIGIKKNNKLSLTTKQVRVLCEAMWDFKIHIDEMEKTNYVEEKLSEYKINEVDELFKVLQKAAGYDFVKQLEKCKNRKRKKEDIGEDALILSNKKEAD